MTNSSTEEAPTGELPVVLAVDDVEANLLALEALLEGLPCQVVRARSGNEALRKLLKQEIAVLLLDVQMPEMDGFEVAHHVRSNPDTSNLPILFLTAHQAEDSISRGYDSGAVDFLFKPINPHVLRSKVSVFLELHEGRKALDRNNEELRSRNADLHAANAALEAAYLELKTTQAQLVQAAKMASLGELVAGVAHEINNPLAFLTSHLNTVERSLNDLRGDSETSLSEFSGRKLDRAQHRLGEMILGVERIKDLVLQLRTFSRLDEGERKVAGVRETVEAVLTIIRHRLGEIQVETHFGQPDRIDCYPGLLNQALMNLVSNSIDAIEGSGKIVITTGQSGDDYEFTVDDTGSGIPSELVDRLVEPFFTTKDVGEGTGLGLSITYSIVQKHGGVLEFENRPEGGTRARIRIPLTNVCE